MAVVKVKYVKRDKKQKQWAKANIRYIQHRRGFEGAKLTRQLFGSDGALGREEAYRMIDAAEPGTIFFKLVITPDPAQEDPAHDLNLRDITEHTLLRLQERVRTPLAWVAAVHADHVPHRHVHCLALVRGRLNTKDLQALRAIATEQAVAQRREQDLVREQSRAAGREGGGLALTR
jgi:hypothetical protein